VPRTTNKCRSHFCFVASVKRPSNLKCVFTEFIKINHKTIKHVTVYEVFVTVEVNKSKLIIVILKNNRRGYIKIDNKILNRC